MDRGARLTSEPGFDLVILITSENKLDNFTFVSGQQNVVSHISAQLGDSLGIQKYIPVNALKKKKMQMAQIA